MPYSYFSLVYFRYFLCVFQSGCYSLLFCFPIHSSSILSLSLSLSLSLCLSVSFSLYLLISLFLSITTMCLSALFTNHLSIFLSFYLSTGPQFTFCLHTFLLIFLSLIHLSYLSIHFISVDRSHKQCATSALPLVISYTFVDMVEFDNLDFSYDPSSLSSLKS